jgi:opacity protein-like surface antigen
MTKGQPFRSVKTTVAGKTRRGGKIAEYTRETPQEYFENQAFLVYWPLSSDSIFWQIPWGPQMRKTNNGRDFRTVLKTAGVGAGMLAAGLLSTTAANAQCTSNFNFDPIPGFIQSIVAPAASSVNALVSVFNTANTAFLTQSTAFIGSPANPKPNEMGGGIWARGIGGSIKTEATGIGTADVPGLTGNVTCNTTARVNFVGYQAGRDIAKLNIDGWNLHTGGTVGYVETRATDLSPGGTGTANSQIPFFGWYGAATKGGFFIDGQVRWDYYNTQLNDPTNGIFNQNFNARGLAVTVGTGYYMPLPNNWFIEPSAGFIWSKTKVEPIQHAGTADLANNPGLAPPGTIQIEDVESKLGRLSLRVGTNVTSGSLALQPFATVSVLHEFAGDVITRYTTCFGASPFYGGTGQCGSLGPETNATLATNRVGTYGQYALGIAGQIVDTGWLGYVRGDYRYGDRIDGWSVNGGVRYQFTPDAVPAPALVGKGPVYKAPPAAVAVAPNWTGFYIGGFVGTAWGDKDDTNVDGDPNANVSSKVSGFLGGGQAGYNYQIGKWVVGLEGDIGATNAKGSTSCPNLFFANCMYKVRWLASVTPRLGFVWDRALIYGKGGGAWTEDEYPFFDNTTGQQVATATVRRSGWTVGTGVEFALTQNWSAKGEWTYADFGTKHVVLTNGEFSDIKQKVYAAKIGLNYRFGPIGVSAK